MVLILILVINFKFIFTTKNMQKRVIYQDNVLSKPTQLNSTELKKVDPYYNLVDSPQNNQSVNYSIQNVQTYNFTFNNLTRGNAIFLNRTQNKQIGYFSLNQTLSSENFTISLLESAGNDRSAVIDYQTDSSIIDGTYGMITFTPSTNWFFEINTTYNFNGTHVKDFFYLQLKIYLPDSGYSFDNPITVYDSSQTSVQENSSLINYNVLYPYEDLFFKLNLEINRRVDFNINEITPLILDNSIITFYQLDPSSGNPLPLNDPPQNPSIGSYNYSWVSNILYPSSSFWIKIQLQTPNNLVGNFSISISYQKTGYSFSTAIPLKANSTITYDQQYSDRYSNQKIYFKFQVPYSDVNISFSAKSKESLIFTNSKFNFYFERSSNFIFYASDTDPNSGIVKAYFIPSKPGTYYIEYVPATNFGSKGSWKIEVSYINLPSFVWPFEFILIDIFYFLVFPLIVFYFRLKNNSENIIEWEIDQNYTDIYKILSKNPRLNPKMEVPFQKILLLRKNLLLRDIIIDIVPVHLNEEDKNSATSIHSSIGFRFKNTVNSLLSILVVLWLITFWAFNILLFVLFKRTLLPYRVADLASINQIIFYLIFPISILVLIIYFYKETYLKLLINEIEYSINESNINKTANQLKTNLLDTENLMKNLAYVRVLWNQAIKAFNEKNYSLFIIRADNSVKKLLETRFQQLIGTIDEKLEFNDIIEAIRNQGFDIPSTKKIEFFRKVRNKVVHSSHLLDEKTAIETFNYYSKFLGRLGLRT